eukprot:NODE_1029_length_2534_cov_0.549487.p2 type:complete len:211 gc:universal NODE_1029_length_2534_cov_0.549487:2229-1597(-)
MSTSRSNRLQRVRRPPKEYKGRPCLCWVAMCCCSSLFIILLILTIFVGTFTLPVIKMNDIKSGDPPYQVKGGTFSGGTISGDLNAVSVYMNWVLKLGIENHNFYGLRVDHLSINIYYRQTNVLISQVSDTTIDVTPNSNQQKDIPVSVVMKLTGDQASTYREIMSKCGSLGGTRGKLQLRYEIKIDTSPLNWFAKPVIKINLDNGIMLFI